MKKTICLVLSLVLLFLLVSCSAQNSGDNNPDGSPDSTGNDSGTPANDGTTIYYVPDDLPDTINYNGEKVVFLTLADSLFRYDVLTDELNSEPVNDSVFNRERFVEERLGVDITDEKVSGNDFLTKVNIQNSSNDDTYQIYAESTVWFASTVFDGYLTDLYELDYIDFSKPWWSELFNNEAELGGRLFMTTGSLSLSTNRFLYTFYYNKKLAEDYSNSYPDLSNLYNIVFDGKWTFDLLSSLASEIYEDLDGDSVRGDDDLYGFGCHSDVISDGMWSGFDVRMLGRDEDGWLTPEVNEEKLFKAFEMLSNFMHNTKGVSCYNNYDTSDYEVRFAAGELLFFEGKLNSAESASLRNMQDEYGLLPYPKFDDKQKEYYSYAHDQYVSFSIPATNRDPDMSAAVLEAMASYSYRETLPTYLDLALKGKYMNDASSRKMVDLIVRGFRVDAGWIYALSTGGLGDTFRGAVWENSSQFASDFTKALQKAKVTTKEIKNKYSKMWES